MNSSLGKGYECFFVEKSEAFESSVRLKDLLIKMNEFDKFSLLKELSESYDCDWTIVTSLIYFESRFDPLAEGKSGEKGLMQITRFVYGKDADAFNEVHNLFVGISYFGTLKQKFVKAGFEEAEAEKMALASYNCGPTLVDLIVGTNESKEYSTFEKRLPKSTARYVKNVVSLGEELKKFNDVSQKKLGVVTASQTLSR
jgi:soluble lytic murein transglycosylase-like protein